MDAIPQPSRAHSPSATHSGQVRNLTAQLLSPQGQSVVRNLDFYRKAEEQLLASYTPYNPASIRLPLLRAER